MEDIIFIKMNKYIHINIKHNQFQNPQINLLFVNIQI